MLPPPDPKQNECLNTAVESQRRVDDATDPLLSRDLQVIEKTWLSLANSYVASEGAESIIAKLTREQLGSPAVANLPDFKS
jgi:hypothetical protein